MTAYSDLQFNFGDQRLVGQQKAREYISRIIHSNRLGHAYLISGPPGSGKTAHALAFAEILNGVNNLTQLGEQTFSKKSSWFFHPDIHLFLPVPTSYKIENLGERLQLLNKDPYEIISYSQRPSLTDEDSSKNKQAFYPIKYFHKEVRPKAFLKPNEGRKTVIILTNIETMRKEAANAFLKLLEEPSEDLLFLLTTQHTKALLPTIISRCQHIKLAPLSAETTQKALAKYDGKTPEEAQYLARISEGNYAMARYLNVESLKEKRQDIVNFLRYAYIQDAHKITHLAKQWHSNNNIAGQIGLLNTMETFLRDLLLYRESRQEQFIINIDWLETIKKFSKTLQDARLNKMVAELNRCRPLIYQHVQPKLIYTVLALKFSKLMRNHTPSISPQNPWQHLPAFSE